MAWRPRPRHVAVLAAAAVVSIVLLAAVVHTPAVRLRLFARVASELQSRFGIVATADRVDYNLFSLDISISGLTLAAEATPGTPFLTASALRLDLPLTTLTGRVLLDELVLDGGRVALVRTADGRWNLPSPQESEDDGEAMRLDARRIALADLQFVLDDRVSGFGALIDRLSVELLPAGNELEGTIDHAGAATLTLATRDLDLSPIEGALRFDGTNLFLEDVSVQLTGETASVSGTVESVLGTPRLSLDYRAAADLGALRAWAFPETQVAGRAEVSGTLTGPTDDLDVIASVRSPHLDAFGLQRLAADANVRIADSTALVDLESLQLADGIIEGRATVDLTTMSGSGAFSWTGVSLGRLLADLGPELGIAVATRTAGKLDTAWSGAAVDGLSVSIAGRTEPEASGDGLHARGEYRLVLSERRYTAALRQELEAGLVIVAEAQGDLPDRLEESSLSGSLDVPNGQLSSIALTLQRLDIHPPGVLGTARGPVRMSATLGGTLEEPTVAGRFTADGILVEDAPPVDVSGRFTASRDGLAVQNARAVLGENRVEGEFSVLGERLRGSASVEANDLSQLSFALPQGSRPAGVLRARVSIAGTTSSPRVEAQVSGGPLTLYAQPVQQVAGTIRLEQGDELVVPELRMEQESGTIAASGRYRLSNGALAVVATGEDVRIDTPQGTGEPIPLAARLQFDLRATGTIARPSVAGRLEATTLTWRGDDMGPVHATIATEGEALRVDAASSDLRARATVQATPDPWGPFDVEAYLDDTAFEAVAARIELSPSVPLEGSVNAALRGSGDFRDMASSTWLLRLNAAHARVDDTLVRLDTPGELRYGGDVLRVDDIRLRLGATTVALSGAVGAAAVSPLTLRVSGGLADFEGFARLGTTASEAAEIELDGEIDAVVLASGSLEAPRLSGSLTIGAASVAFDQHEPVAIPAVHAAYEDGVLEITRAEARWRDAALDVTGTLPARLAAGWLPEAYVRTLPASGDAELDARFTNLRPEALAPYVDPATLSRIGGRISGSAKLQSAAPSLAAATGELVLDEATITLADVPIAQRQPTRLVLDDGRLTVAAWDWSGPTTTLQVAGGLDLDPTTLDLTVEGRLDLRAVSAFVPDVATAGDALLRARLEGTPDAPLFDGGIQISDAELRVAEPRLAVTGLTGAVVFDRDRLVVQELSGFANGGPVSIRGELRYPGLDTLEGTLAIDAREVALRLPPGVQTEAAADITLTFADGEIVVGGEASVVRGGYREPLSVTTQLLALLDRRGGPPVQSEAAAGDIRLDLRVRTVDDLVVDNNYGRFSIGADLTIRGTPDAPVVLGRAEVREGGTLFVGGTPYRVETGAVDFTRPGSLEPDINIVARTRVSSYDIRLSMTGTPQTLQVDLTADDPRLDQADIVSLLVTGRTVEEAGSAEAEVAREQLLGYLSGEFLGTATRALGLDVFRVERGTGEGLRYDPTLVATETDPAARLTFGKSVRRNVDVVFSQSLRKSGDFTWIIEYRPGRNLELRAVSRDEDDRSYEFRHDVTFGGEPEPVREAPRRPDRVSDVTITGATAFEPPALLDLLSLERGDRFDFYEWQDDRERLERFYHERLYREARVTTRRVTIAEATEQSEGAIALEYAVAEGPLTAIDVRGDSLPGSVVRRLDELWRRSVFDRFLVEDVAREIRAHLVSRNQLQPTLSVTIEESSGTKTLTVELDGGERVDDRVLAVEGADSLGANRLEQHLDSLGLLEASWIEPERAAAALESLYVAEGFLDARVSIAAPRIEDNVARLPVGVDEGAAYTVERVAIAGATAVPDVELRESVAGVEGNRYRPSVVAQAIDAIETRYRDAGFNEVRLDTTETVDRERSAVAILVQVDEGPRQIVRDIEVEGADATRTSVVARALDLELDEPVNLAEWYRARKRLYDTNLFRRVELRPEPIDAPQASTSGAGEQPVRAVVSLEEWPALRFQYGFQVNDTEPLSETASRLSPGLVGDLEHRNLLGLAIRSGVALRIERDQRIGRAFVALPTLFGLPVTSSLFVTRSRLHSGGDEESGFVTDVTGVTGEQAFRPAPQFRVSYSYTFERNHTFEENLDPDDPFAFDLTVNVARLNATALYDTRDDLLDATRGWFHSSSLEYASASLGSDLRFAKYLAQSYYFRPVGPVVLASAVRVGIGEGFGQQLIPSERFFAGGGNSVRGFPDDGIGPRDFFGDAAGGEALLVLNQEVRFPIGWRFRGVGFFDAGNVFPGPGELSITDLQTSIGAGLRLYTPFVLLRLDYGRPLDDSRADGTTGRWFFSIGQMF